MNINSLILGGLALACTSQTAWALAPIIDRVDYIDPVNDHPPYLQIWGQNLCGDQCTNINLAEGIYEIAPKTKVAVNGVAVNITHAQDILINVSLPDDTTQGHVVLTTPEGNAVSPEIVSELPLDNLTPLPISLFRTETEQLNGSYRFFGSIDSVEPGSIVIVTNTNTSTSSSTVADATGQFTLSLIASPANTVNFSVSDSSGNTSIQESLQLIDDPRKQGSYFVGTADIDDPNGISGITDPTGINGPAYPVTLAWARIMYPANYAGDGALIKTELSNLPVVLFLHGVAANCNDGTPRSDCPIELRTPLHEGYNYIMENLASHGYFVISISAHDIVSDVSINTRTQLILAWLNKLTDWNTSSTSPFNGKLDLNNIGLVGHSRGGAAVLNTPYINNQLDTPYGIKAIAALAPADYLTENSSDVSSISNIGSIPFFIMQGSIDGDTTFGGNSNYNAFNNSSVKMSSYLLGGNHNYFNTITTKDPGNTWATGIDDPITYPLAESVMSSARQREVTQAQVSAFLRWHLNGEQAYQGLFDNRYSISGFERNDHHFSYTAADSVIIDDYNPVADVDHPYYPLNVIITNPDGSFGVENDIFTNKLAGRNFMSENFLVSENCNVFDVYYYGIDIKNIACFSENGVVGEESPVLPALLQSALHLKWQETQGDYISEIPSTFTGSTNYKYLSFRVAKIPTSNEEISGDDLNFEVNVADADMNIGNHYLSINQYSKVPHPFYRGSPFDIEPNNPMFMSSSGKVHNPSKYITVRIPLSHFTTNTPNLDPARVQWIVIRTNGTGEMVLDNLSLTN